MRPLTEQQQRLIKNPVGYTVRGRVRVLGPDGNWRDLTNLFGRDFLEGVDVDESLDSPVGQATVRVLREVAGLSLAPLMTASRANNLGSGYSPLLDPNRLFRVEVALGGPREFAANPVWLPLFMGRIDSVDSGNPDTITFVGRDMAGVLQDVWTGEEKTYGSDAGVPLETVCQAILTDAQLGSDFALYTPVPSEQALGKYKQDFEPTMDALSKLAAGRGWEVRGKLRPDTGDWGLWLWGPDRTASAPVWTYTASDYQYLGELRVGLEDVRTAVEVTYPDASDLDAAGHPKRKTVRRESATALARYGYRNSAGVLLHRLMRVTEGATTNLRSAVEAGRLADTALADLSTTDVGASVEVALHPALELADLVCLTANGVNFSADQVLAVRQLTHSLTSTSGRTRLRLLGKPALGPHVWLSMEARPGIAPGSPFTGPAAPSGLTVTNSVTGAVLSFTAPNITSGGPAAEEYELHVGTSPGFTLSSLTRRSVSSSTSFDVTGLLAGGTYYARVRSRDRRGNVGPASAEVVLAPKYVAPGDLAKRVSYGDLPLNGSWEALNGPGGSPDAWTITTGAWNEGVVASTNSATGGTSLKFPYTGTVAMFVVLRSDFFIARPGELWSIEAWTKSASGGALGYGLVSIRWYSSSFGDLGTSFVGATLQVSTGGVWTLVTGTTIAPSNAKYGRVEVQVEDSPRGVDVYIDSVIVEKRTGVEQSPQGAVLQNAFTEVGGSYAPFGFYRSSNRRGYMEGRLTRAAAPASGTLIAHLPADWWPKHTQALIVATNTGAGELSLSTAGELRYVSGGVGYISLDGLSYRLK